MAIYIRAVKLEENDEYLIYSYGEQYDNLTGKFKYYKTRLDIDIIKYEDEEHKWNYLALNIAVRIKKFYDEKGYYPDSISKQS